MRRPVPPKAATALCRALGLCLIVAAITNAASTMPFVRGLLPLSVVGPHFIAILVTWALMAIGGVGLLARQPWAFIVVYVACGLNVLPAFCFLPFADGLLKSAIGVQAASHVIVYGVNTCLIAALVWSHISLERGPGSLRHDAQ